MTNRLFALTSHPDVTRFEIEDALVREAPAELLGSETSISAITVDLGLAHRGPSEVSVLDQVDSFVCVSAENAADDGTAQLPGLAAEAAIINGSWLARIEPIAELTRTWTGTATPGPKVTVVLRPIGADSPEFQKALIDAARTIAEELSAGARATLLEETDTAPFSAAIAFWFASISDAREAFATNRFAGLASVPGVDADSVGIYEATEHRILPNPNIWTTTTGLERPEDS